MNQPESDNAEALVLRLRAHLAQILRMLEQPTPTDRAARRAQRRNRRREASP